MQLFLGFILNTMNSRKMHLKTKTEFRIFIRKHYLDLDVLNQICVVKNLNKVIGCLIDPLYLATMT